MNNLREMTTDSMQLLRKAWEKNIFLETLEYLDPNNATARTRNVADLINTIRIFAMENKEKAEKSDQQKLMEQKEYRKMAAAQIRGELGSETIPKLFVIRDENNFGQWITVCERRWRLCCKNDKTSLGSLVNTIRMNAGPVRDLVLNKRSFNEIFCVIKRKYLNGHIAIENLFNLKNIEKYCSLDTAKCVELMDNFQLNGKLVIKYNLHTYLEPKDTRLLAESMLLH